MKVFQWLKCFVPCKYKKYQLPNIMERIVLPIEHEYDLGGGG